MWLAPSLHGRGVATQLVMAVKVRVLQQGHREVHLQVAPNTPVR
ncbi:GNAT family N-acetyltransferase [Pseudomonas sp. 5P_3.1_Bac2]